jgi:hypothetical protein
MNHEIPQLAVPLSRRKLVLVLLGCCAFVAIGAWMISMAKDEGIVVAGAGLASILCFGLGGVYALFKLFDPRPALIIDAEGIIDNSSAVSVGRVRWDEITGVGTCQDKGQRFLVIGVIDPEKYVKRTSWLLRPLVSLNVGLTGSPITIPSTALALDFNDVKRVLVQAFETAIVLAEAKAGQDVAAQPEAENG